MTSAGATFFSYWERWAIVSRSNCMLIIGLSIAPAFFSNSSALLAVLAIPAWKSSTYRRAQSKSCHPAPGWWLGTG